MEIGNQRKEIREKTEGGPSSLCPVCSNKKKKQMVLGIVMVFALGAGIFYWENREIKGSPDDYAINDRIIENKRAGLKIQAPEGWDIEKIDLLEGSMVIKSKDIDGEMRNNTISPPLTKGCGIEVSVLYKEMNFEGLREEIENIHWSITKFDEFEEIEINNRTGLKNTFDVYGLGPGISVSFVENRKVYSFCVYWGPDDEQRCVGEFEEMLEGVEIE